MKLMHFAVLLIDGKALTCAAILLIVQKVN